jgi:hypothetical protein
LRLFLARLLLALLAVILLAATSLAAALLTALLRVPASSAMGISSQRDSSAAQQGDERHPVADRPQRSGSTINGG